MIKDLGYILGEFKGNITKPLKKRITNNLNYIGEGIYTFTEDVLRLVVLSSLLAGAFYIGKIAERVEYSPQRIDIEQNVKSIDVIIDGRKSGLVFNKGLNEEENKVVFTTKEYSDTIIDNKIKNSIFKDTAEIAEDILIFIEDVKNNLRNQK